MREERRLTVSVGVGPNRLIAKIASDFDKPDGLTVVPPAKVQAFLDPLPVRRLHGVGPATEKALAELGIATVADLRRATLEELTGRFGKHGADALRVRARHRRPAGRDPPRAQEPGHGEHLRQGPERSSPPMEARDRAHRGGWWPTPSLAAASPAAR